MKTFILRVTPYVIALFAGIVIYLCAQYIVKDDGLNNLIINVASGLVSVPLVFICYEVVDEICNRNLKNTLLSQLVFELNYFIIDIINDVKNSMSITEELNEDNLEQFLDMEKKDIRKNMKIKPELAETLKGYKNQITNLLYKDSNMSVLPNEQIRDLLRIAKKLGIISKELEVYPKTKNRAAIDNAAYDLMQTLGDWVDYVDSGKILAHHGFTLTKTS
ncbi:MAG: hypothetical protein LBR70_01960 [Lactobacillaceae bacterium]|jgi:hypothetical protein|nr:hypothetical protein [Lactobacillaceae bacterium]